MSDPKHILVVDDDKDMTALLKKWLEDSSYRVDIEQDGNECIRKFSQLIPDVICLDLNILGLQGLEVLKIIHERNPAVPVIILTSDKSVDRVVSAMQLGAFDYLTKPLIKAKFLAAVAKAADHKNASMQMRVQNRESGGTQYKEIVGSSHVMKELFLQLDKVALSDVTVFIHGESGSGKELFARAIHNNSGRSQSAFIAVNCAAIPENIAESELFGHEKGAFTGATTLRKGRLEEAHNGTLFLDEVAELSLSMQARLLRALQEKSFYRVGGAAEIKSDFRLIAATHKDLSVAVKEGRFRSDLFFRISVFELDIPPLRTRKEDIPELVDFFLKKESKKGIKKVSREALDVLMKYAWPGNIRELQNVIQSALVVSTEEFLTISDLPKRLLNVIGGNADDFLEVETAERPIRSMEESEKAAIVEALKHSNGNVSKAMRQLKISRTTLYRKMKKYQII